MNNDNRYTIECPTWLEVPNCIKQLSSTLLNKVIPAQKQSNKVWDIIRIEIWEDTGRFIAFPSTRTFEERTDVSVAQIVCKEIEEQISAIDYSNLSEDEQDKEVNAIVTKMATSLKEYMPINVEFEYEIYNQDGYKIAI